MKFNKLLALVGACATFSLVACGDDSSSGADGTTKKATIVNLDEMAKSITFYAENKDEYCVLDEATKSASWKTIDEGNDTMTYKYEFMNLSAENVAFLRDSLKYSIDGNVALNLKASYFDKESSIGIFVGGDASSIKGTWVSVPCSIDYDGIVSCRKRDEWEKVTLKITSSSITADIEYIYEDDYGYDSDYDYDYEDYDYYTDDVTKSRFLKTLYEFLGGMSAYSSIESGWSAVENVEDRVAMAARENGIAVKSQSNTSVKFDAKGKSYDLSVKNFGEDKYGNLNIDLTLSSGGKTCSYTDLRDELEGDNYDKSACRSDLYEYYKTDDVTDYTGVRYDYAYEYRKETSDEFSDCVAVMAGISSPMEIDDYDYDMYFKKPAKKMSDAEFWSEYKHNMHKVLKQFK